MLSKFIHFEFDTCEPEEVGISSADIAAFEAEIREKNIRHQGYIIYKDGKIAAASVAAPYRITDKRHVYSVSKSWTSTAIGIAVDEGLLTVEDSVISFFPDELPETVSENLAKMKVKHLLSMNTGHKNDTFPIVAAAPSDWVKKFLSIEVEYEPGTHFCYNTTATYMLSAIITKLTGMRMTDYLRPRLFNPLGIKDVVWSESPEGIDFGGWGIHVSMVDMLKLGVLYLNKGVWNGKRILSEEWISEATSPISDSFSWVEPNWACGYGYQIWMNKTGGFRFDGAHGQFVLVSSDKNCVTVLISELNGIIAGSVGNYLDIYWDKIYSKISDNPIEKKPHGDISVKPVLQLPMGDAAVSARSVKLEGNPFGITRLDITPGEGGMTLTIFGAYRHAAEIFCGFGEWEYTRVDHNPIRPYPQLLDEGDVGLTAEIAAAYAVSDGKLTVSLVFVSSPHGMTLTLTDTELTIAPTLEIAPTTVKIL